MFHWSSHEQTTFSKGIFSLKLNGWVSHTDHELCGIIGYVFIVQFHFLYIVVESAKVFFTQNISRYLFLIKQICIVVPLTGHQYLSSFLFCLLGHLTHFCLTLKDVVELIIVSFDCRHKEEERNYVCGKHP